MEEELQVEYGVVETSIRSMRSSENKEKGETKPLSLKFRKTPTPILFQPSVLPPWLTHSPWHDPRLETKGTIVTPTRLEEDFDP